MNRLQPLLGFAVLLVVTLACSEQRRRIQWRAVIAAFVSQAVLTVLALRVAAVQRGLATLASGVGQIKNATLEGTRFVFGYIGGAAPPFELAAPEQLFVFAFQALPMVMVVSALAMLLFYWGILPWVVRLSALLLSRTLHIGGALGVCAAAKLFLGQTDAPLLIRPYLGKLTRSELFTVMTMGMATTSASTMVIYASILETKVPNAMAHVLTAALIALPAAVAISRLLIPETEPKTAGELDTPYAFDSAMGAIAEGASDGLKLYLNIIAMLIVMLALVALLNSGLGALAAPFGHHLSLELIFGWALAPVAFLMGIPWHEATAAGHLIGTKLALNEVMAFVALNTLPDGLLSHHSTLIMTYALCGFANLGSVGIQVAGFKALVPERQNEIAGLALRAMLAGTAASCLTGAMVGFFI